jgi:outer membrane lipase/esterase
MKSRKFLKSKLALAVLLSLSGAVNAQSFSSLVVFGDSNSDDGRYKYLPTTKTGTVATATANNGSFTTNPGQVWTDQLGNKFGFTVKPSDAPSGGTNYAAGGAQVSYTAPNSNAWSATSQVGAYLASTGGRADPNALYVVWVGSNDLKTTTPGPVGNIINPQNTNKINVLADQTVSLVTQLSDAGAKYIVVPNTRGVNTAESVAASGYVYTPGSASSKAYYDQQVWNGLLARGINFIPADSNTLYNHIVLHPERYGLVNVNVNTPACGATTASYNCSTANLVNPTADRTYLFADGPLSASGGGHFTTAGQQIQADYFYGLLTAPSQVSLIADVASLNQTLMNSAYLDQIGYSFRDGAIGSMGAWSQVGLQQINVNNTGSNNPVTGTAGIDYQYNENLLLGAYIGIGQSTVNLSSSGNAGAFTQNSDTLGVYAGFRQNALWVNGLVSYNYLNNNVNRNTPIGITSFNNNSTVNGSVLSLAARAGYDFTWKNVTHGPMVGLAYQSTNINSFTESGNYNSLKFGSQSIDVVIASIGYQASAKLGDWEPFARVMYNGQSGNDNRQVNTSLTSINAPSWAMPAVAMGNTWTDLSVGVGYHVAENAVVRTTVTSRIGQNNVSSYMASVNLMAKF